MTTCTLCLRPLDPQREPVRHNHCANRLDQQLYALPGLYALMGAVLAPGAVAGGGRVSGNTRTAPIPARLEPLNLRGPGGMVTILAAWETHWRGTRGLTQAERGIGQRDLAGIVMWLRAYLPWAIEGYTQIRGFADAVNVITQDCRAAAGILPNMMYIGNCPKTVYDEPCGTALYVDAHADSIQCKGWGCRTTWFRPQWVQLGKAMRGEEEVAA